MDFFVCENIYNGNLFVGTNPLAPEFSFKFEHTLYIKCE